MNHKVHDLKVLAGYRSFGLHIATAGIVRTLPGTVVKEFRGETEGKKVDRSRAGVTTQIVRREFLKAVGKLDSDFKELYRGRTKPSPITGIRRPRYDADALVAEITKYSERRRKLGEEFADKIDEIKAAAKEDFPELYRDEWFPATREQLLRRFSVTLEDYHIVLLDDPNEAEEIKTTKVAEMQAALDEADKAGQDEKRKDFLDKASTLLGELKKGGKGIYQSVVEGMKEFCTEFHPEDDPELAPLVTEVGKILEGKTADDLRNFKGDLTAALKVLEDVVPKAEKLGRVIDV